MVSTNNSLSKKIKINALIVAGEVSGDNLAYTLISHLRQNEHYAFEFWGTGGDLMAAHNVELIKNYHEMEAIGFEILVRLPHFFRLANQIAQQAVERKTDIAILIDYPGFNLLLAKKLKKYDIPVVFYVAPQVWAWRYNRVKKMRQRIDLLLLLYRFEKEIFDREKIPSVVVGHPMAIEIDAKLAEMPAIPPSVAQKTEDMSYHSDERVVTLMPGSRATEIHSLLPFFCEVATEIRKRYANVRFLVPYINKKEEEYTLALCKQFGLEALYGQALPAINAADLVILASGTATLEVAYLKKPMLIVYRLGKISYAIMKRLVHIPYIGLVNILAQKKIVPEFIQDDVNLRKVMPWVYKLMDKSSYEYQMMAKELAQVRAELKARDPGRSSADAVIDFLTNHQGS